jgi:hypothetical protein
MMYLMSAGLSPCFFMPSSIRVDASCALFNASIRMMPSDVFSAQALTQAAPTKVRLSNARPGGGAGLAIWVATPFSTSSCDARVSGAGLHRTVSACKSVPAAWVAAATWAAPAWAVTGLAGGLVHAASSVAAAVATSGYVILFIRSPSVFLGWSPCGELGSYRSLPCNPSL